MRIPVAVVVITTAGMASSALADGFTGPSPYLSKADSPFAAVTFGWFHLEDFEDGLNEPGLSITGGQALNPGAETDSVDDDDGVIDGLGQAGHSWLAGGDTVIVHFDATILGGLPTHAGVVWTDTGLTTGTLGVGRFIFEPLDAAGLVAGSFGPFTLGDGDFHGQTAEDRFMGFEFAAGMSGFQLRSLDGTDWELDHVQYGQAVPAPASVIALAGLTFAKRRRR